MSQLHLLSCADAIAFVCESEWGFAEIDPDGNFIWVNPAYCKILNAPLDLIINTNKREWTHPGDIGVDNNLSKQVKEGIIPSYTLAKRYIQRGSTPQRQMIIWGLLSVSGKWKETGEFVGYRVQFRPYIDQSPSINLTEIVSWIKVHWKTILTIVTLLASLTLGSSSKLVELLVKVKDSSQSVDGALDSLSSGPSPQQ